MSMEAMMNTMLKWVESSDAGVKEMKRELSIMSYLVDSHSISIKQMEYQINKFSTTFNQQRV